MFARVGDRLTVHSNQVGGHVRTGEIIEVQHSDGTPPYLVAWSDTGTESLVHPGPDATVEHAEPPGPGSPA